MTARFRAAALLLSLIATAACAGEQAEEYGFIATLGNDTTSVERIVRTGDRVVGDAVGRSPLVVRRRWEATLAPDGTIRRWSMDTHVMNGAPEEQHLHHEAEFLADRVRLVRATSRDTTDVAYSRKYEVTVPWNAFLYGSWELLFQAAQGRPDT
ncbi:MAG TPA: hypothetical protein VK928_05025, partial [Longimicrobiales bacterium]|nr:hypothetical protein [Longimicrobiales bacterium]